MIGASITTKYILAIGGSIINGVGVAFLFTCQGSYIHKLCTKYDVLPKKGYYYGLFNSIFTISTIIGAIVVTFGLDLLSHQNYFILVRSIALFASVICWRYQIAWSADLEAKR